MSLEQKSMRKQISALAGTEFGSTLTAASENLKYRFSYRDHHHSNRRLCSCHRHPSGSCPCCLCCPGRRRRNSRRFACRNFENLDLCKSVI
jgi:hypothetical protein